MSKLFSSFNLSGLELANRIVMAPLTRSRAPEDVASERIALYYAQRATAGLIVSEGTPVSREGQGYLFNPGIFTRAQIEGWRLTTQSVHSVGGRIFAQIWHVGRVSHATIQEGGKRPVSGTSRPAVGAMAYGFQGDGKPGFIESTPPRALDTREIDRVVSDYAQAAENAIEAGFDGVEIHGANGYLIDQFINPLVNDRTDQYSAQPIENRLRFAVEVVDAVAARIGKERVGVRLSPYGAVYDMPLFDEIDETYLALVSQLGRREIAYVHLMDHTRFGKGETKNASLSAQFDNLLGRFRALLPRTAIIVAGGMTRERADDLLAREIIDLAAFGQLFIANPDLVARLRNDWPLATPDRSTYYGGGATGFIDYPPYRAGESLESR
ncbi:N-ethylmaleimide reductase [Paraburkholderia sacchari]|uniref:alkene reductase n=1 Tax=Paraburkholderia sacchari TaxID=159450 RepID=UPI0039A52F2D